MNPETCAQYISILEEELVPAMGCTEPIAVAYAAALARDALGCMPEHIEVLASANIIKNVKSVIVPNTGSLRGPPRRSRSRDSGWERRAEAGGALRRHSRAD